MQTVTPRPEVAEATEASAPRPAFTLTANERFAAKGGYLGMLEWLIGQDPNGKWMTWLARETMEEATSK